MPSKKQTKTSKTAHVLNILTDPGEAAAPAEAERAAPAAGVVSPAPAFSHAPTVLEIVKENDEAVSDQIRSALEAELDLEAPDAADSAEGEAAAAEAAAETAPPENEAEAPPAAAESAAGPAVSEAPAAAAPEVDEPSGPPAAQGPAPTAPEAPAPEEEAAPEDEAAKPPAPEESGTLLSSFVVSPRSSGITYVNVMQALVEEKVGKYIKMFGLCSCPRCRIDVIALALTNLSPKYVVMRQNEMIPMLSVYEGRYNAAIITQVIWACKQVMDFPRHEL